MQLFGLNVRYILLLILSVPLLNSCSNTRYLTADEVLLRKNEVNIQSEIDYRKIRRNIEENISLEGKLATLAKQQPNKKTLGLVKLNLTIYNRYYTTDSTGLYHWIINTIGEPPVLFDSTYLPQSAALMHDYMVSKGYLLSSVAYDYKIKRQRATPQFMVKPGPLYTIDSIYFPKDTSHLTAVVRASAENTLLKTGNAFDADVIGSEQLRIFQDIQDNGYYHFLRDNIFFEVDTSNQGRIADIFVKINGNAIDEDMQVHYIGNIYVRPDYFPENDELRGQHDTTIYNNLYFIDPGNSVRMDAVAKAIFISQGQPYSQKDYDYTLVRLSDLGVFKFISIRFNERPGHLLDCFIYLTPARKHALTTEVEASNIEDNVGAAVKFAYKDKNVFRSANTFDVSLNAGTQIPVFNKDSLIFNVSGQVNFYLRRFVVPFNTENFSRYFNPITKISLLANYYQQTKIYILNNYSFTFGYEWKENALKRHIFNPFAVSYVNSTILSDAFQQRLDDDPFLRQSFEDQLIAGLNYSYIFSNQGQNLRHEFTFLRLSGEVAGTALYLINTALGGNNTDATGRYVLFGTNYANFVRFDGDLRHYFQFTENRSLVLRAAAGMAINYWNSDVIPYIKQFFLGGTSSMRAWSVRSLGPGAYKDTSNFFNSAGDIKLEGNIEYRFNIFSRLDGAVFLDAGNIWLRKNDPNKPGANFEFNRFLSEVAIGTGIGFRFDFTYFILRLDVATPLRDPAYPAGDRWVVKNLTNRDTHFVKDNLLFNLAIGYPF